MLGTQDAEKTEDKGGEGGGAPELIREAKAAAAAPTALCTCLQATKVLC